MSIESQTADNTIPQRENIPDKYKWNLKDIYPNDTFWEEDFNKAQTLIVGARTFRGRLAESPATLYECLETRSELSRIVSKIYFYAFLSKDLDNRVSRYQEMTERSAILSSQAGTAFAFVEPELLQIDEKKLLEMASKFEKTDVYDFYIKELIRSRKHIRSTEVEEILAMSSVVARGAENSFNMLDNADLTYPSIKDEKGNELTLTKQRYAKFLESSDRRVRKEANEAFYTSYKSHLNTLSAMLSTAVNKDIFYAKARKFDNCLSATLYGDNIPDSVYRSLIESTEANIEALHKYTALRKKVLRLDPIMPYDMLCPLFPDQDFEIEYDEAVSKVIRALEPLGEKYIETLKKAFNSRWVDVFETPGKGSGAYSAGDYSVHPYVLMNYNKTVSDMFTLAHEMGHALHSHLANAAQPYPKAHYSTFVAEVASTLNESLLLQLLLNETKDDRTKLYLLNRYADNTMGTYFHQVMYAHFELLIHEEVEKGGALSPDMLTGLWRDLTHKYYGPELVVDDHTPLKWSRIPHFYLNFYVFQYATSYAASQAIMAKFLNGESGLIERYLEMLSAGGKDYPMNLLKICGVDMSTPEPFMATVKMFDEKVEEMNRLT
ncbi:MAG: oligoendopeptidase F [candidate division Zixibacteria bacterium]|nr:oligoendopeptidase F [candidate division Zixibacteria bacterium]MDD5425198.1 oligoendopeptidase F [candidate division Zixibacteria bacterium]